MSRTFLEPIEHEKTPADVLGAELREEFDRAEKARRPFEENWLKSARQYAGQYDPDKIARMNQQDPKGNRSRVFIRHTKARCDTLKARLMDLLFPSNSTKNWTINCSPKPEVPEIALIAEMQERQAKGEQIPSDMELLTREVAEKRARAMAQLIEDQLNNGRVPYRRVCGSVIRNGVVYGAGCLKGPLIEANPAKRYVYDAQTGQWSLRREGDEFQPFFEEVPCWDLYPDPAALCPEQLNFLWQSHNMTRRELAALSNNPGFHGDIIKRYLSEHPDGEITQKEHETELRTISRGGENTLTADDLKNRYRVLERWGYLSGRQLLDAGMKEEELLATFPDFDAEESFANNLWMTDSGVVIKCSLAPVEDMPIPYWFFRPYADGTGFWSESLPDILRDPQIVVNAAARMTLDNASIACGPQLAVNMKALAPDEDPTEVHARKVWLFDTREKMSEAIREVGVQSHITELMAIAEKFQQYADESSFPRYMSGNNAGVRGAGDTASGLSMLMNSASMPVKDCVNEFDTGVTEPFIRAMYRWNMRFSSHEEVKGDYEVVATGSTALVAQELMGQRLLQTMQVLTAPGMANMTDFETLYSHVLRTMNLPADIQLSHEEAKFRQMEQMKMEKAAQLEALMGEIEKRNLPVAPELINMVNHIIASLGGAQPGGTDAAAGQPMPAEPVEG